MESPKMTKEAIRDIKIPRSFFADRGEQPDQAIHSPAGALRGDVPLSKPSESEDK